jgi:hypothetical protein
VLNVGARYGFHCSLEQRFEIVRRPHCRPPEIRAVILEIAWLDLAPAYINIKETRNAHV